MPPFQPKKELLYLFAFFVMVFLYTFLSLFIQSLMAV